MSTPIACPNCGSINWWRSWTGRFYEEMSLTWQEHTIPPHYELTFDNEDQHDSDTEPWECAECREEPDDELQELLSKET